MRNNIAPGKANGRRRRKNASESFSFSCLACRPKRNRRLCARAFSVLVLGAQKAASSVCVPTVCCCCLCHTLPSASSVLVWWTALSGKITAFSLASIRPTYRHSLIFECFTRRRSEIMNALRPLGRSFVFYVNYFLYSAQKDCRIQYQSCVLHLELVLLGNIV